LLTIANIAFHSSIVIDLIISINKECNQHKVFLITD